MAQFALLLQNTPPQTQTPPRPIIFCMRANKGCTKIALRTTDFLGGLREIREIMCNSFANPYPYDIYVRLIYSSAQSGENAKKKGKKLKKDDVTFDLS